MMALIVVFLGFGLLAIGQIVELSTDGTARQTPAPAEPPLSR
jgi:hypothetical protein